MVWAIFAASILIGGTAGWFIVSKLPKRVASSRFDRVFVGTIVAFGVVFAFNIIWFIAGCIMRLPGVPLICT